MTHCNSTAKELSVFETERSEKIELLNLAHRRNIIKQKIYGAVVAAASVASVLFAEDVELLLAFVPVGIFLMLTKHTILTFEQE